MKPDALTSLERRTAFSLASVFGLRMLGLFMLMPVLAIYGQHLDGYSPLWIGLAIGAYGLTQALFQIPMGLASDRFGRKPVILVGLVVFAIGSLVAAQSESIYGVTLGRALQGAGAIASAVLALAADLTREQQRTKVMAAIGMCIGLSFALALVVGPALAGWLGLKGLFWATALLALLAIAVVMLVVPDAVQQGVQRDVVAVPAQLKTLLVDRQLLRLDGGIFILHLAITAVFVALPLTLVDAGLASERHWWLYLPALLISFALMVPVLIISARTERGRLWFLLAIGLLAVSLCLMALAQAQLVLLALSLVLFFTAFNYLEASLPAMISRQAPAGQKGSAMGIYSTGQFLGAFVGGSLGGVMMQFVGLTGVFLLAAGLMVIWLLFAQGMQDTSRLKSVTLAAKVADISAAQVLAQQLMGLTGVAEATVVQEDGLVYLKVDKHHFDQRQAERLLTKEQ